MPLEPDRREPADPSAVRRRALRSLPLAVGAPAAGIAVLLAANRLLSEPGHFMARAAVLVVAGLCVPLLAKLSELITGVPFGRLAASWDGLRGWQRGVLGLLVAVAALGTFGAIALAVALRAGP